MVMFMPQGLSKPMGSLIAAIYRNVACFYLPAITRHFGRLAFREGLFSFSYFQQSPNHCPPPPTSTSLLEQTIWVDNNVKPRAIWLYLHYFEATAKNTIKSTCREAYLHRTSIATVERNHAADSDAPSWVLPASAFFWFKNLLILSCASLSKENSIKS